MEPDELYTLRAQYWLGHYNLSLEEGKASARRPTPPHLKIEREEFMLRALLALKQYDRVIKESSGDDKGPGIRAINLSAQYSAPTTDPSTKLSILSTLQQLLSDPSTGLSSSPTAQLIASQLFLSHGEMTREAFQCVHLGTTMEHLSMLVQIYIRMDRIDLAKDTLRLMKQADEEAILTQLSLVYIQIASGRSEVQDAIHHLNSLSEQYGPSPMLLINAAVANMVADNFGVASNLLNEVLAEDAENVDALINLLVCYQHEGREMSAIEGLLERVKSLCPDHPFVVGLTRVEVAFEREAAKYKVAA